MFRSLRARLLLGVLIVDLLLGAVFTFSGYRAMNDWIAESVQSDAHVFEHLLVSAAAPLLAELNLGALQDLVQQAAAQGNLRYVVVRDPASGRVLASAGALPDQPVVRQRVDVDGSARAVAQGDTFHFGAAVALGRRTYGQLEFGLSSAVSAQAIRALLTRALTISAAGLVVASALLLLITGILTRGLSRLTQAARQLGAGGDLAPLPVTGGNEVAEVSAAFNDMTQRLSSRMAALARSEAVQRGIADAMSEAVLLQGPAGRIEFFNPAALSILGLSIAQLRGDEAPPAGWLLASDDGVAWAPRWPPALPATDAHAVREHLALRLPDGRARWLSANRVALPAAGDGGLVVWSIADISGYIGAQEQLQRANHELEDRVARRTAELAQARDAAESASRAKSEFLSRMSHELRTPLNAILGFAQLIPAYPGTAAPVLIAASHIEKGGWQLLALIDDILDLSSIEAGKIRVDMTGVDVGELAADCLKLVQPLADGEAVALQHDIAPGLTVMADRVRLAEVLNNLLSNAVKYNRAGGVVRLRGWRREDGCAGLSVEDTGGGMSVAQLSRLFRPFDRLGAERSAVQGTGIGLVITRRLVELMGGQLSVRSQLGQGSAFEIALALGHPAPAGGPAPRSGALTLLPVATVPATPAVPSPKPRVLYIEDNEANAMLMQALLAHRPGLELEVAGTGAEGLALARANPPALLLIDIRLPDTDGAEVCRTARADPRLKALPMFAISADAMPADRARCLAAGFDDYLTKPLKLAEVLAAVDRALNVPALQPDA